MHVKTEAEIGEMHLQAKGCRGQQTSQGIRGQEGFSLQISEGTNPADTSIVDFQPPELGRNKFLLF